MPDLQFEIETAIVPASVATPQLSFKLRIASSGPQPIHSIALRVQVQIEPARRFYSPEEREHLKELFGGPEQWSKSLQPLLWTNVNLPVQGFEGNTTVDLPVPCTFDFNVAMTKYVHGLTEGDLPLAFLFSGTVFYAGAKGLQIEPIPWDKHANYRLPVRLWKEMMDTYYPNTAWICLHRDVFERINEFRERHGIPTVEQALERVLGNAAEVKP